MSTPTCSKCGRPIPYNFVLNLKKHIPSKDVCTRCRQAAAKEAKRRAHELPR